IPDCLNPVKQCLCDSRYYTPDAIPYRIQEMMRRRENTTCDIPCTGESGPYNIHDSHQDIPDSRHNRIPYTDYAVAHISDVFHCPICHTFEGADDICPKCLHRAEIGRASSRARGE